MLKKLLFAAILLTLFVFGQKTAPGKFIYTTDLRTLPAVQLSSYHTSCVLVVSGNLEQGYLSYLSPENIIRPYSRHSAIESTVFTRPVDPAVVATTITGKNATEILS